MYFSVAGVASAASNLISVSFTGLACNGVSYTTVYQFPYSGAFEPGNRMYSDANLLTPYTGFFTEPNNTYTIYVIDGFLESTIYHYTGATCLGSSLTLYSYDIEIATGTVVFTDKCADESYYDGFLVYPVSGSVYNVISGVVAAYPTGCPSPYTGYSVAPCGGGSNITIYQTIDTGFNPTYTVYSDEVGTVFTGGFTADGTIYYSVSGVAVNTNAIGCLFSGGEAVDCCSAETVTYYTLSVSALQDNLTNLWKYTASPSPAIIPYTGSIRLVANNNSRALANGYQTFANSYYCLSGASSDDVLFYSSSTSSYISLYTVHGYVGDASQTAEVQGTRWFTQVVYDGNPACASDAYAADGFYAADPIYGPFYQMFNGYAHLL